MSTTFIIINVISVFLELVTAYLPNITMSRETLNQCGLDKSPIKVVYEGNARIETYPWLGILFYQGERLYSTSVVLVTRQIVIGSAMDIDRLPKSDFRYRARVVLGQNCSSSGIKIREYTYHPDFTKITYSALALIQLETNFKTKDLRPVCAPPKSLEKPQFYVLALSDDCKSSKIKIYKMAYVSPDQCKAYYRRTELDVEKMWPTYTICARALHGRECIWRNGAILLLRQENKWSLIGFGIHGPGCRAPARFLDYVQHRSWVRSSMDGIGKPTVTRISRNQIILRRTVLDIGVWVYAYLYNKAAATNKRLLDHVQAKIDDLLSQTPFVEVVVLRDFNVHIVDQGLSNVQRYGPCDAEEIKQELFTDRTTVHRYPTAKQQRANYNFTIFANMEYTCVVFRVFHYYYPEIIRDIPYIRLHRFCLAKEPICYSFQFLKIDFGVEIWFKESVTYHVAAYGREVKLIDMKKLMVRVNSRKPLPEVLISYRYG